MDINLLANETPFMDILGHIGHKTLLGIECDSPLAKYFGLDEPLYETSQHVYVITEWVGWASYHLDCGAYETLRLFLPYLLNGSPNLN